MKNLQQHAYSSHTLGFASEMSTAWYLLLSQRWSKPHQVAGLIPSQCQPWWASSGAKRKLEQEFRKMRAGNYVVKRRHWQPFFDRRAPSPMVAEDAGMQSHWLRCGIPSTRPCSPPVYRNHRIVEARNHAIIVYFCRALRD